MSVAPKEELQSASGFFNLTRQLGGSVGVALLTTLLARRQAFLPLVLLLGKAERGAKFDAGHGVSSLAAGGAGFVDTDSPNGDLTRGYGWPTACS
jgi:hypothetical protein